MLYGANAFLFPAILALKTMILVRLREATKPQHQQLEATVDVLNRVLDLAQYEKLLRDFYGFYAPVERRMRQLLATRDIGFDYEPRLKVPLLARDLAFVQGAAWSADAPEICHALPPLKTFAQGLGCLYVLEGATLGGQLIGRHLRQQLQLTAEAGAAFFNSYGAHVGAMWKAFGTMATEQAEQLGADEEIIASAQDTFTTFDEWLRSQNNHEQRKS